MENIYLVKFTGQHGPIRLRDGKGHLAPVKTVGPDYVPFANQPILAKDIEFDVISEDDEVPSFVNIYGKVEQLTFEQMESVLLDEQKLLVRIYEACKAAVSNGAFRVSPMTLLTDVLKGRVILEGLDHPLVSKPVKGAKAIAKAALSIHSKSLAVLSPEEAELVTESEETDEDEDEE